MFASQACLRAAWVRMAPCPCNQLNAKDVDTEQALLLCYVTIKVLVKYRIHVVQLGVLSWWMSKKKVAISSTPLCRQFEPVRQHFQEYVNGVFQATKKKNGSWNVAQHVGRLVTFLLLFLLCRSSFTPKSHKPSSEKKEKKSKVV